MLRPTNASALFLACLLTAGCITGLPKGPSGGEPAVPDPTPAEVTYASIPEEANVTAGRGVIQGVVVNPWNDAVPNASVALLGTPNYVESDDVGRFGFSELAVGRYAMRVDVASYESTVLDVLVRAGESAQVTVRLAFRADVLATHREHIHDLFDGKPSKDIVNGSYDWPYTGADGPQNCDTVNNNQHSGACLIDIPLRTPIPPGTDHMELAASWKEQPYVSKIRFWYWTNGPLHGNVPTINVSNGQMRTIAVTPEMTDSGHAVATTWRLMIELHFVAASNGDAAVGINQGDLINQFVAPFHIRYTAIKGKLWPEPAHPRAWARGARLVLANNLTTHLSESAQYDRTAGRVSEKHGGEGNPYFKLLGATVVPPGTTRLDVILSQEFGTPAIASVASRKTLAFRTGMKPLEKTTLEDLRVEPPVTLDATHAVYRLQLSPNETDTHYTSASNWLFLPANEGKERDPKLVMECPAACGGITFTLLVVAVNENYAADYAAGRV